MFVLLLACLGGGCDTAGDEARREYSKALELSHTGQPLEEQLAHMDRAVRLAPTSALYLEARGNLHFSLGRLPQAKADYDRAVELADRPYLRFERADLLCALGEYGAALADLDRAIAAQPENLQFYPRRALARLAVGRVAPARTDVDHAIGSGPAGSSERYARAAVLLMEGKPSEALVDLDFVVAHFSDPSDGALPRTLRLLAHAALDQRELAAAEFDRRRLDAADHWPELGYRHWLVRRGCGNAFIVEQAGDLIAKAESMLAGRESTPGSPQPPATIAAAPGEPAPPGHPALATSPSGSPSPPHAPASTQPIILLDYLEGGANPVKFSLNPEDLPAAALEAIGQGRSVWLWTEQGQLPGIVDSIDRDDDWKAYRGGLSLTIKVASPASRLKGGWAVLSSQPFPSQTWTPMEASAREKANIAKRLGYAPDRLRLHKLEAREHHYLVVDYWLPCPDASEQCGDYNEVETTVYQASSEAGWRKIDSFVDGGSTPFVDIDGDGIPEFVGSTGYKGYVLRRILPTRQVIFTSRSGV